MRDEVHIGTDQLSHQLGKSLIAPLRSAVLDDDVRALDTAEVTQAEPESLKPGSKRRRGCKAQNPTPSSHELRSRNGILWYRGGGWPHSGLILAARITLPHFSVYSAMNLPNSAGELANGSALEIPEVVSRRATIGVPENDAFRKSSNRFFLSPTTSPQSAVVRYAASYRTMFRCDGRDIRRQ
jgi:hypothetical protein